MNQKLPEILAPAGSYDIMVQAFQAGADAVYLGGHAFGARAYASNLSEEELVRAIEYAQLHHKRIYLTVNTLLKDEEINRLSAFLKVPYEAGLDGVIVQDYGVATIVREQFPDMELHASTQMTILTPAGANALKSLGVSRVVPARELSIQEIQAIKEETGLEVEVFVHGALCYCYSGQCLLSSRIGGRSGNRGRCAQPCRQSYSLSMGDGILDHQYYLSPKDLCGLEAVPALMDIGVDSFKIEGRMKKAEYVISAVTAYRKAVDDYWNRQNAYNSRSPLNYVLEQEKERMADIFNRGGFTAGYFNQRNGLDMMAMERNNHNGLYLGTVTAVSGGMLTIKLSRSLHAGDLLEIRTRQGLVEVTSGTSGDTDTYVSIKGKQLKQIHTGDKVYRTKNHALCDELIKENLTHALKENVQIFVTCRKDFPVTIKMEAGGHYATITGSCAEKAQKQPITQENLEEKLRKLGDAPFQIESIAFDMEEDCFFSMKEFNQMRRQVMEELENICKHQNRRSIRIEAAPNQKVVHSAPDAGQSDRIQSTAKQMQQKLAVYVSTQEQLDLVLENEAVSQIGLETEAMTIQQLRQMLAQLNEGSQAALMRRKIFLALPHIYRLDMKQSMLELFRLAVDGYLVRTVDELALLREQKPPRERQIILDSSIYTYNHVSAACVIDWMQADAVTLPAEYSREDIYSLFEATPDMNWNFVIYGRQALMVTAQCTYKNLGLCRKEEWQRSSVTDMEKYEKESIWLRNQFDDEFQVERVCKYCYNVIYHQQPDCYFQVLHELPEERLCTLRIHLTNESQEEVRELLQLHTPAHSGIGRFRKGIE
jgi:putative protease